MPDSIDFHIGDLLTLRKPHPCGGTEWEVVRLGMDIGLVCKTCGHRVLMVRSQLERRVKAVASAQFRPRSPPPGELGKRSSSLGQG